MSNNRQLSLWMLRGFLDSEEHVGQEKVPVSTVFVYHPLQKLLTGLVKPLHKAVSLEVVDGCPQVLYLQQPAQINH